MRLIYSISGHHPHYPLHSTNIYTAFLMKAATFWFGLCLSVPPASGLQYCMAQLLCSAKSPGQASGTRPS